MAAGRRRGHARRRAPAPADRRRRRPGAARGSPTCSRSPRRATCPRSWSTSRTTRSPRSSTTEGRVVAASANAAGRAAPHRRAGDRRAAAARDRRPGRRRDRELPAVDLDRPAADGTGSASTSAPAWSPSREATASTCGAPSWSAYRSCGAARRRHVAARRAGAAAARPDPRRGRPITEADLVGGSPAPAGDDEVGRLATTMNRMLDRLERASERQRRFVADASHDLQSPLTAQRAQLEVAMAQPDAVDDAGAGAATCWRTSTRWSGWSATCCSWSPTTSGPRTAPAAGPGGPRARGGRAGTPPGGRTSTRSGLGRAGRGDAGELRRLVRNLVENAVAHAATHGRAAGVERRRRGRSTCSTTARACPPGRRTRSSSASTAATPRASRRGSGLGLSIARTMAERHGGSLVLVRRRARRALPADPAAGKTRCRGAAPAGGVGSARTRSPTTAPAHRRTPLRARCTPASPTGGCGTRSGRPSPPTTTWCGWTCGASASRTTPTAPGRSPSRRARHPRRAGRRSRAPRGVFVGAGVAVEVAVRRPLSL